MQTPRLCEKLAFVGIKSLSENDFAEVLASLVAERDPDRLWRAFSEKLAELGFDKLNYTVLMPTESAEAPGLINPSLSTMPLEWLADYKARRLDLIDPLVEYATAGGKDPILFDTASDGDIGEVARTARRGGMKSGVLVPIPEGRGSPAAGMVIGSSLEAAEAHERVKVHGALLMAMTKVFHAGVAGQIMLRTHGAVALSTREKACLQAVANGQRISAIAHDLKIAEVTVGLHLKNARKKLGARSLPEAVARGLVFQQIETL